MDADLKSKLLPDNNQTSELEMFLCAYFGRSSQPEPNKVVHGEKLVVEYYGKNNKNHKTTEIKSIYLINNSDSEILKDIEVKAKEALSLNNGVEVVRHVLFSPYETKGNYRYCNDFQILIPPSDCPKADQILADHPFILEFTYKQSSDLQINIHRRSKRLDELSLILNVFLKGGVKSIRNNAHKEWVIVPDKIDNTSWESRYLQQGYMLPDEGKIEKDIYGFTIFNENKILHQIEPNVYYAEYSMTLGETLSLPSDFSRILSKFFSLNKTDYDNCLRASYWKKVGSDSFHISQSNAYIALVNAIESLIPQEKAEYWCISCQKEIKKGLTQLFHDFVENYVPGLDSNFRKELYAVRSKYTHGKHLMPNDMLGSGYQFNPSNSTASSNYRTLAQVVQVSIFNWFVST